MGATVGIAAASTAVGVVGGLVSNNASSKASDQANADQQAALELQGQEDTVQYQQKQLSTYDLMTKTLDSQIAAASVSGVDLSSPSLNAIQRDTINTGGKKFQQLFTENEINQTNIKIKEAESNEQNDANQAKIKGSEFSEIGSLGKTLLSGSDGSSLQDLLDKI